MRTPREIVRTLCFAALLFGCLAARADEPPRPNIILIMTDDMGFSDLGCYGGEIRTPNLDGLAEQGLRFAQFYNTSRCCPTRASLMTGLYAHQAGMGGMTQDKGPRHPAYRGRLTARCVTLAEVLGPAGYRTICTGKWHLGDADQGWWPTARGFDRFYGCPQGGGFYFRPSSFDQPRQIVRGTEVLYDKDNDPPDGWYTTDAFTDEGLAYVEEAVADAKPFFWYLAYNAPHFPLQAKPQDIARYLGKYKQGWDKLRQQRYDKLIKLGLIDAGWPLSERDERVPAWQSLSEAQRDEQDLRMATYAAMIDRVDQNVGRIIDKLKALDAYDNTLILFLADNGGASAGGGLGSNKGAGEVGSADSFAYYGTCWANVSDAPFRKYKAQTHEGGIATPLIAHWPDAIPGPSRGGVVHTPAHVIDIMPTCLQLAGAQYPERHGGSDIVPVEGRSLLPILHGEEVELDRPLFFEHQGARAVRHGRWKLVAEKNKPWELYDMLADRTELNNLADRHPERVEQLESLYKNWARRCWVDR